VSYLRRPALHTQPRRRAVARAGRAVVLTAALVLLALPAVAAADEPNVASPNAKVGGLRLPEWLGLFWTHALPLPTAENPIVGNGDMCPVVDGVVIGYGIFGETCTVPRNTEVLVVSIVAPECSTNEPAPFAAGPDLASLLACAEAIESTVISEDFTVDGQPIRHLDRFRVQTGLLDTSFPIDNPAGATPGPAKSASVGTAVIVKGLDVGIHEIRTHVVQQDPGGPLEEQTGVLHVAVTR